MNEQDESEVLDSSCWELMRTTIENLFPQHINQAQLQQLSPAALAYLGDAVYELYVRMYYLLPPQRSESYHRLVVAQVRAEKQALHLRSLITHLRHSELEIVRRAVMLPQDVLNG